MRKCNLVTLCLPEVPGDTTTEHNMERALERIDAVKELKPDLILLPEVFQKISVNLPWNDYDLMEECRIKLGAKAKELNSYIIVGLHEMINGKKHNVAWLLDRQGELAGRYVKNQPTDFEITGKGVWPGTKLPVFETDFGKVGVMICYDIDFPHLWQTMEENCAELVAWISAYDGGYPLNAYAAVHQYYVASSVRAYHARIIDITGKELESSSRWANWAFRQIDFDKTLFHMDGNREKLHQVQKIFGNRVKLETYDEEGRFTMESFDPEWPVERIRREFQMETFKEYHARTSGMCDERRVDI